jgi:hypothetical protein
MLLVKVKFVFLEIILDSTRNKTCIFSKIFGGWSTNYGKMVCRITASMDKNFGNESKTSNTESV